MTTAPVRREVPAPTRRWERVALGVVLLLVAANAVYGGVGLVVDGMGMPADWLVNLPVDSWVLPGVALLVTVAVPQLAAAVVVWRSARLGAVAGVLAGLALVLWIVVQLLVLQRYFVLQPVIAGLGLVEVLLGVASIRRGGAGAVT